MLENFLLPSQSNAVLITALMAVEKVVVRTLKNELGSGLKDGSVCAGKKEKDNLNLNNTHAVKFLI